jgi:hypothetical protein
MKTIPKVCHLYWDKSPMALLQVFTVVSFHKYNPDWKIIIYLTKQDWRTELGKNIYVPDYTGKDWFYMIEKLDYVEIKEIDLIEWEVNLDAHSCQGSDLFRRNILYKEGGVYSDFDVIWLKPMNEFVNIDCIGNASDFESIVSFYEYTHGFHNVSNLISEPGSQYIYSLIEEQRKVKPPYDHQAFGSEMLNKKYPDLNSITSKFPRILAIKYETFYPYNTFHMESLFIHNDLTPLNSKNVMCVHWFNGNRFSKEYINTADYHRKCSMTSIMNKEDYYY